MKQIVLYILFLTVSLPGMTRDKNIDIVFIGNSITQGVIIDNPDLAPPAQAVRSLRTMKGIGEVAFFNNGVSGSTTVDHLPATGTLFSRAVEAADHFTQNKDALLVFSVMLGTNDSASDGPNGSPVSPQQYRRNMATIIDSLLSRYPDCRVVVHHPLWYSPETYNGARYLQEGLDRLCSYFPEIDDMVKMYRKQGSKVYAGDVEGFGYFSRNHLTDMFAEDGRAGVFYLHPNQKGAEMLGKLWAARIYKVIR